MGARPVRGGGGVEEGRGVGLGGDDPGVIEGMSILHAYLSQAPQIPGVFPRQVITEA